MTDFFEHLDDLFRKGDHAKTEEYLKGHLEELDAAGNELMKISVLNELGSFYRGVSRYQDSADCFEKAFDLLKRRGMKDTPYHATMLLNYAGTCRLSGRLKEAVSLFLSAKKLFEDTGLKESYEYGSTLNNLAIAYQDLGDMEKALDIGSQALDRMRNRAAHKEERDAFKEEVATALGNLASILLGMGELEKAEALAAEALSMYDAKETGSAHHAAAISTMGAICFRQGRYDIAVEHFEKSLELTRGYFGRNIEYAVILHNIAVAYEAKGDVELAIEYQTDALDLMERLVGETDSRSLGYRRMLDEMVRHFTER